MRWLFAVFLLVGCGSDDGGGSSGSSSPILETFVVTMTPNISTKRTTFTASARLDDQSADPETWGMALVINPGATVPECTLENGYDLSPGILTLPIDFSGGETYSFRGCVWNKVDGTFHDTKTQTLTTPILL